MESEYTLSHFGEQLKTKREAMGLSLELIANHLKLSKRIIIQLEQPTSSDLPASFIKGYLKSYAKYLQFSEQDIYFFLDKMPVEPPQKKHTFRPIKMHTHRMHKLGMRIFNLFLSITLIALSAAWWYNRESIRTDDAPLASVKPEQRDTHQIQLFLSTLDTLQNPKKNFTEIPPAELFQKNKVIALHHHASRSYSDDNDEDDEDDEE